MKKLTIAFALLLFTIKAFAQPANDNCAFAQSLYIPQDGQLCFNSTNLGATPDGVTPNACNGPTGGNEVWYSYVTTGTQNTINVLPIAPGPAQTVVISVPNGNCMSNTIITCNSAASAGSPANVNFTLPIGTQVWFEVTSKGASGSFKICITSITPVPNYGASSGDSCFSAIRLCSKESFTAGPPAIFASSGDTISCYKFGYQSDLWYKFKCGKTGTLEWTCTPQAGLDIDWDVLDITAGCVGAPSVCCNFKYSVAGGDPTGMNSSSATACGGATHIVSPIIVTAGQTYAIHLNYTSPSFNTFDMTFGGTFEIAPFPDFYIDFPGGCAPHITDFTDSSFAATSYTWTFGNGNTGTGNNPVAQNYPTPGNYLVSLLVNDAATGCSHTASNEIIVGTAPTSTFTASQNLVCENTNDTITYTGNGDALATYTWDFIGGTVISGTGQGPYIIQWATAGTKAVTLTVTQNGCPSIQTVVNVTVHAPPSSAFNIPAVACAGDTVLITYTGVAAATAQFYWNTGNSFTVSTNSRDTFYVVWGSVGMDSITLQIDDQGCISTKTTNYITIGVKPVSTFTLTDSICNAQPAIAVYTGIVSPTANYNWTFGGGVAIPGGTVAGPQNISFATPGYHAVNLIVNEQGCLSALTKDSVFVTLAPSSTFTVSNDSLCGNQTATITYTGTASSTANYNWSFGTATIVSGSGSGPYVVSYSTAGLHYISLDVSENGCTSTPKTDSIRTAGDAVANAGLDAIYCNGDSVQIGTASTPGYVYTWSPTTGISNSSAANPYSKVANNGATPIITNFIVTAKNGFCIDKDTVKVTVNPKQNANITVTPALTQCLDVNNFNFSNTAAVVSGASFNWDFTAAANVTTATTSSVNNVTYSAAGNYLIQLITTTVTCPNDTDTITISVNDAATADFIADTTKGCPPIDVTFSDKSTNVSAGSTYSWSFGNGNTSTLASPPLQPYSVGGNYTVTLSVTSPIGCVSTKTKTNYITITDPPIASFTPDPSTTTIIQPVINFINTSVNADSCHFDFGNGITSNDCNASYEYLDTGTYLVMLIVTNAGGCTDTAYESVTINDFYTLYIPNSFTPNGDALNDYFFVTGYGIKDFSINIFNGHGQTIFSTNKLNFTWDGKDENGQLVMEGNYIYEATIKDVLGKNHTKSGNIILIR